MPVSVQRPLQPVKANDRSLSVSGLALAANDADALSPTLVKPDRPCDACRRRKSRCVINTALASPNASVCTMCAYQKQQCTFNEGTVPRKRKIAPTAPPEERDRAKKRYVVDVLPVLIVPCLINHLSSPDVGPEKPHVDILVSSGHTMNSPQLSEAMNNTLG